MNKYIMLLILPFLLFVMVGCDDGGDDVIAPDLALFAGTWEVVEQGDQEVFARTCILDIKQAQIHEGFGGYQGYITSYFLTVDGTPRYDKVFTWSVREVENQQPLLDVAFRGELDSDDIWAGDYPYKITKLDNDNMWWQVNTNGDNSTIKFRRRNDIHIER